MPPTLQEKPLIELDALNPAKDCCGGVVVGNRFKVKKDNISRLVTEYLVEGFMR
jgi:hypothetical protein